MICIYQQMIIAGQEIDSHESDLYVKVTDRSQEIVDVFEFKSNVKTFVSQIDGCLWFDIPFSYLPFWEKRSKDGPSQGFKVYK